MSKLEKEMKRREELDKEAEKLENKIKNVNKNIDEALYKRAMNTGSLFLKLMAEAMIHVRYNISPITKNLGYEISTVKKDMKTDEEKQLWRIMNKRIDQSNYVFSFTHYDTMSNGHYYRMS